MTKRTDHDRVTGLIEKWKPRLLLHGYVIRAVFLDDDGDDGERASIACSMADSYHVAVITFRPAFFEMELPEQERAVVHELTHIPLEIVASLIDLQRDGKLVTAQQQEAANERVTDWLATVIVNVSREV